MCLNGSICLTVLRAHGSHETRKHFAAIWQRKLRQGRPTSHIIGCRINAWRPPPQPLILLLDG